MIKEVNGDILHSNAEAIGLGVAPFDHFESGLALSLKEQWPSMVKDFRHYCHMKNPKPGSVWIWAGANGKRIVNLMTKEAPTGEKHSGHAGKASISNVNHSLKELAALIRKEKIKSVALPKLESGFGGLDWADVKILMESHLNHCGADVFVYSTYQKDVVATE